MLKSLLGDKADQFIIFDQEAKTQNFGLALDCSNTYLTKSWEEAYQKSDIFLTCTTTSTPYIDIPPKPGSIHLNISLRDYHPKVFAHSNCIIVDDWDEVCRENTDIYRAHLQHNLTKDRVIDLVEFHSSSFFKDFDAKAFQENDFFHFNPMGMSVFDIAIATDFYQRALDGEIGVILEKEYCDV